MSTRLTDGRQVGSTSLFLPPLGLGAAHFGGMYERVSGEVAHATMQEAWDCGVRFFDVAPYYGRGLSEHRVGDFLIDRPRDEFVLTTKVGRYFNRPVDPRQFDRKPWVGGLNMEIVWDYSYDGFMRSYEQSLLRLGLDTIDALLIHDPEAAKEGPDGPKIEDLTSSGFRALEELKRGGQIRAIGMGLNSADALVNVAPLVPLDFAIVAAPYTLLDQSAARVGMQYCVDQGISVVVGAPYASGILATGPVPGAKYRYGPAPAEILDKTARIVALCEKHGCSLQAAALQFPLAHPAVVSVIPGAVSPQEVSANVDYFAETIPRGFWLELAATGLIDENAPLPA